MKALVLIFLILFSAFLLAPTIISITGHSKEEEVLNLFDGAEEENSVEFDEYSKLKNLVYKVSFVYFSNIQCLGVQTFIDKYQTAAQLPIVYFDLLSPPPKLA
ncbi:hypothetical protein [Mesonia aestuariivivens]|uniref:Uncharacterized protein n=1 Tax=Mesonia aestuariivivens TaxID=2796128 RepID=A0ABS6VYC9_9FLAO|nr:hypothetical protein [Mesonia aestuariivivens]MBW2960257.1 hypothetical protein [Mesonia aestuariivivens]